MNKIKKVSIWFSALLIVSAIVPLPDGLDVALPEIFESKTVSAEAPCPPPQSSSHMIIRKGSSTGELVGEYHTEGPNHFEYHTIDVEFGEILWVNRWTENVEAVNRTPGSVHSSNIPGNITSPSSLAGFYSSHLFSRQSSTVFTTSPLTNTGHLIVSGTNSCIGDDPDLGQSSITISVAVGDAPYFELLCGTDRTVNQGQTANYAITATPNNGYSSQISVTMGSDPVGPVMNPTPIQLNPANNYQNVASVPTIGLDLGNYVLTFTASDGTNSLQCQSLLTVLGVPSGSIDLQFNGSNGPTTPTPPTGSTGTLTWVPSGDVASCIPSMVQGVSSDWTGTSPRPSNGTQNITGLEQGTTYIFKIDCVTSAGSPVGPDQVEVIVGVSPEPPTATLLCEGINTKTPTPGPCDVIYGSSAILTWSSEYTTECSISPGTWGTQTSGSGSTSNLTSNTTYTLTCEGTDGSSVTSSVQINIVANPDYEFVIVPTSDVRAQGQISTVNLLVTNPTQGFNSPVVMSVMNVAPPTLPISQIQISQNPVTAPYNSSAIAEIDTAGVPIGNYVIIFRSNAGTSTDPKTRVMQLQVTGASAPTAPVTVNANAGACSEIEVTWNPGAGHNNSIEYRVYRSTNGIDWSEPIHTIQNNGQPSYSFNDTGLGVGTYYYRVSASVGAGGTPAYSSTAGPVIVTSCAPSLDGSYKRVLGAGTSVPPHSSCGSPNNIPLPNGNVYVSGQTVFFEICVRNSGNETLTNVSVSETNSSDQNLENVQFVRSSGNCASGSGAGPYTIGNLVGGGVCSIVASARISNPGGPASTLHRFINFANITSSTISRVVNTLPEVFSVGAGIPDRVETSP